MGTDSNTVMRINLPMFVPRVALFRGYQWISQSESLPGNNSTRANLLLECNDVVHVYL